MSDATNFGPILTTLSSDSTFFTLRVHLNCHLERNQSFFFNFNKNLTAN